MNPISNQNQENAMVEEIDTVLETLRPNEAKVIRMRYGLNGKKELTQREIAKKLGISRSYVSRIEKAALETLRRQFD